MAKSLVKLVLCLLFANLARTNEFNVETSTMSLEEVETLVEDMDSNNPTYERAMIMKYLMPTFSPTDSSANEEGDYIPEVRTGEWFELPTEPVNEEYVEVFQPTHEVVLPVQEQPSPVQESDEHPAYVGSSRGIAGYNYPNYFDIPLTSFTCTEKDIIPGFYADLETGCQVFHVCWPHRRESFLCPVGTIFNQALLACDFWYNSNCSMAPLYYNINAHAYHKVLQKSESVVGSMIDTLIEKSKHDGSYRPETSEETGKAEPDVSYIMKFLPVKAKVTIYPGASDQKSKIVSEASVGKKIVKKQDAVKEKHFVKYVPSTKPASSPSAAEIVDEIFDVAKKIVEESRGLASRLTTDLMELHKQKHLATLNPRFITKPVVVDIANEPEDLSDTRPNTMKVVKKVLYKPTVRSKTSTKVSPLTKKVLAGNYLKLLNMKV